MQKLELLSWNRRRPTKGTFNSPVWPVKKPEDTWRITVDF